MAAGCAPSLHSRSPVGALPADADAARCAGAWAEVDDAIDLAGVRDGEAFRVPGQPWLRTTRTIAGLARAAGTDAVALVDQMRRQDAQARTFELANLSDAAVDGLAARLQLSGRAAVRDEVVRCGERLHQHSDAAAALATVVPDDYQAWKRVAGLYALTRLPFSRGVERYQRETAEVFARPLESLEVRGTLLRHGVGPDPGDAPDAVLPAQIAAGAVPAPQRLESLFRRHAPVFEIDTTGADDGIGQPAWGSDGLPGVDTGAAVMFVRTARTLFGGKVLPQLVYSVWFPARPETGAFDLLGGRLDGLTWRVTLDLDGEPLLFDAMHNCGCYHQFFPGPRLRVKPRPAGIDEWAFVPQVLPAPPAGARLVLRVSSGSHQVQRLRWELAPGIDRVLTLVSDDELRSLPLPSGGRRSLFRPDGLVPGSERGERWLFWPMGVREPGAMRQWGRHATAFIGRRHFDDPDLPDRYFERLR
jgi:hypothetical protein